MVSTREFMFSGTCTSMCTFTARYHQKAPTKNVEERPKIRFRSREGFCRASLEKSNLLAILAGRGVFIALAKAQLQYEFLDVARLSTTEKERSSASPPNGMVGSFKGMD